MAAYFSPKMIDTEGLRLYIGGIPAEFGEEQVTRLAERACGNTPGVVRDLRIHEKGFAFMELDCKANADRVMNALDGEFIHGRNVTCRRAGHKAKIWVGNISKAISNEILYKAFETFGQVTRAIVSCTKGKSEEWGFVEFAHKRAAQLAVQRCQEEAFMLTRSGPPVKVQLWRTHELEKGLPEAKIQRTDEQSDEVSIAPRFVEKDTFEYEWAQKWKALLKKVKDEKEASSRKFKKEFEELERGHKEAVVKEVIRRQHEQRVQQEKAQREIEDKRQQMLKLQKELMEAEQRTQAMAQGQHLTTSGDEPPLFSNPTLRPNPPPQRMGPPTNGYNNVPMERGPMPNHQGPPFNNGNRHGGFHGPPMGPQGPRQGGSIFLKTGARGPGVRGPPEVNRGGMGRGRGGALHHSGAMVVGHRGGGRGGVVDVGMKRPHPDAMNRRGGRGQFDGNRGGKGGNKRLRGEPQRPGQEEVPLIRRPDETRGGHQRRGGITRGRGRGRGGGPNGQWRGRGRPY